MFTPKSLPGLRINLYLCDSVAAHLSNVTRKSRAENLCLKSAAHVLLFDEVEECELDAREL
jgi:hypothetical protein